MPISAWDNFAKLESPDGRFTAVYDDSVEVGMGAPTCGVLRISDRSGRCVAELSRANGSFVWSSDSTALAFPRWTRSRMQELVVFRLQDMKTEALSGEYRVLELSAFHDGLIEGIDSPVHRPSRVRVSAVR